MELLGIVVPFRLLGRDLGRSRRPPPQGYEVVLGGVDPYSIKPSVKRAVSAKPRQGPVGLDEGFLRHILHLRRITHEPRQQTRQLALVLYDQQLERTLVAALSPRYQLTIYVAVSHRRSPACAPVPPSHWPNPPAASNSSLSLTIALGNSSFWSVGLCRGL